MSQPTGQANINSNAPAAPQMTPAQAWQHFVNSLQNLSNQMGANTSSTGGSQAPEEPSANAHPRTSLLGLPAEIRNMVFQLAVVSSKPLTALVAQDLKMVATDTGSKEVYSSKIWPTQPALAFANHQTKDEVLPIFYSMNSFYFGPTVNPLPCRQWLEEIGRKAALLNSVVLVKRTESCPAIWQPPPPGHLFQQSVPHSHDFQVRLSRQPGHNVRIDLEHSAVGICACELSKAIDLWRPVIPRHNDEKLACIAKDVEFMALSELSSTGCCAYGRERTFCDDCGKAVGARPFGAHLAEVYRELIESE